MSTPADWSQGVDPMPSMDPSSDLFDGDILGDELIDIYNAAVVGGGDDSMNEIPSMLTSNPTDKKENDHQLPLPQTSNSTVDDGLGAFRPSTSFNDLSTLLPSSSAGGNGHSQKLEQGTASATMDAKPVDTRKRESPGGCESDSPTAKRRLSGTKKSTVVSKSKGNKATSASKTTKVSTGKINQNTPNPLNTGAEPDVAASCNFETLKPITKPIAPTSSTSSVVTPRVVAVKVEEDTAAAAVAPKPTGTVPTEADFKSVAQAAVSSLIANAASATESNKKAASSCKDVASEKIDTSTEHIKALTGSNWVAVCSDSQSVNSANDKLNNRARRQNLTPDERARQNRDRNREHARNTRLRKKAYVEELKRTLTALVAQRDGAELEKRHSAQRELEQREVRFRVVEEFLKLRGRNEPHYARWSAILEDNFTMTLPNTDYRDTAVEKRQFEQNLSGVSQTMADSNLFAAFLRSLGNESSGHVVFAYNCDRKNFFMDNCTAVLNWTGSSQGATHEGSSSELVVKGNLAATFSPASNKLVSVSMMFDTNVIKSQLAGYFKHPSDDQIEDDDDATAAQVAASEADAILDSLQMPHIGTSVPQKVNVVQVISAASITDGEKSDSSDESNGDAEDADKVPSRRMARVRNE